MNKSKIILFIICFLLWSALSWAVDLEHIIAGILCSALVAAVTGDMFTANPNKFAHPPRYFWFAVYLPVFAWEMFKANLDVAFRLLSPKLPIRPGIVKIKTNLKSDSGLTFLANSITLTPGTTTVDIDKENGFLYVHWLNVKSEDIDEATRLIAGKYEKILDRIFE